MIPAIRFTADTRGAVSRHVAAGVLLVLMVPCVGCSSVLHPDKNQPPIATATATPMTGTAPLNVSFKGTGTDPDGAVVGYAWAFGDGASSNQKDTTHVYQSAGTYTATLTLM